MRFLGLGFRARRRDLGYERFLLGFSGSFKDSSNEGFLMLSGLRGLGLLGFELCGLGVLRLSALGFRRLELEDLRS